MAKDVNAQLELNDCDHPTNDGIILTLIKGGKTLLVLGCILSLYLHLFY